MPRILFVVLLAALAGPAVAQNQNERASDPIIPSLYVNDVPLDQVLQHVGEQTPGVGFVLADAGDASRPWQLRVTLHLENVSVEQLMHVLAGSYPIQFQRVPGPESVVYAVQVEQFRVDQGRGHVYVSMHPLHEAVRGLLLRRGEPGGEGEAVKRAMADVLSLLEATLAAAELDPAPVLRVHEPTQTLLLRSPEYGHMLVRQALEGLQFSEREADSREEQMRLRVWEAEQNQRLDQIRSAHEELARRNEELQRQLEAANQQQRGAGE